MAGILGAGAGAAATTAAPAAAAAAPAATGFMAQAGQLAGALAPLSGGGGGDYSQGGMGSFTDMAATANPFLASPSKMSQILLRRALQSFVKGLQQRRAQSRVGGGAAIPLPAANTAGNPFA